MPLILEVQSERFHSSLIDQQLDAHRIERLERAGHVVVQVTDVQAWHGPPKWWGRCATAGDALRSSITEQPDHPQPLPNRRQVAHAHRTCG